MVKSSCHAGFLRSRIPRLGSMGSSPWFGLLSTSSIAWASLSGSCIFWWLWSLCCSITTSDGLGNSKDGFHPIHQRFASFHASQCSFCTPGMCVSLFSALVYAEKTNRPQPPPGFSKITASEAERAISGNLCRCTGYRPIADACKSFAADVDLEDLGGINSFCKTGLPPYNPKDHARSYVLSNPERLLSSERYSWYSPVTIEELQSLLDSYVDEDGKRIKLVVGNTGDGYYKDTEKYGKYIDVRFIPELSKVRRNGSDIEFGAALPIAKVILHLKENSRSDLRSSGEMVFAKLAGHLEKVASGFIRNSASIGGNLIMAQRFYFPSDIATLLLAVGSSVSVLTGHGQEKIAIEEFLSRPAFGPKDVLLSVHIPFLETNLSRLFFETYRAAPRPLGNALPYLNAAFLADISYDINGIIVKNIQLAFGAYGTKHATRARTVEEYLVGKIFSVRVMYEAIELVKGDVVSEEGTSHAAYRSSLAVGFLFEFLNSFLIPDDLNCLSLDTIGNNELLSSSKQIMESSTDYYPVGEPMKKVAAVLQASGEAVYVDDIPSPPNCLHGAFIYSTEPEARVKGISFDPKLSARVAAVISAKDIPNEGENIGSTTIFNSEPLFASDFSRCAGDRIAFVIAETQKCATSAAKLASIDYEKEGLDPPILNVEEAVERSSFFEFPSSVYPEKVGDFSKGMDESDHKIVEAEIKLGSQHYFYMENQTALAVPDEDNCMVVYSSTQNPEYAHIVIARCLGIPEHNVRVITRRVGGGYGGKAMKSIPIATACALAAHKLRRPVRTYLDRQADMIMTGGRHPMKITYTVGFKSDGKITALHVDVLIDAGITEDATIVMPNKIISALKKYNWGALSFDIKVCKTNLSSKTIMRAPGEVQGSFIAESIIEHVASFLSVDVDDVRSRNVHTYESLKLFYGRAVEDTVEHYNLPSIWDKVASSSSYVERAFMVEQFNGHSIWVKRGISRVPIVHELGVRPAPGKVSILRDGSTVVEVGGIELGQGLYTKVMQVTAYALGLIGLDGTEKLVEKVRVVQADTLSVAQGGLTSDSTTSESSCEAARICCNLLVERLMPLKKMLEEEQMMSVNWETLINQAHSQNINLAAQSYFVPETSSSRYLTYGAAVSEVEVNIVTGQTTILRTDIIYDCGQSMNPAVDLGQVYIFQKSLLL
ncbi:aryl-alcohol oxidase 3 [Castilleja foliolosa]|uniref:indole-3-acetaldehyde oxidase n=1 Tax=Castilleja foliolosa TaxID=1961234 RepID=A0ABD3EFQ8_9LAMI